MRVKDKLKALNHRPSKQRGQNFLISDQVLHEIVAFGDPREGENIVEVGPGLGALTELLLKFGAITVVEIESSFCEELKEKFPQLKVINEDVRRFSFESLEAKDLVVFGNLPYVFSTDIIWQLVANRQFIKRAVLLLQREFAERLAAPPGGKSYGSISVGVQLWSDITLGPIINGSNFHPPTKVESRLIQLSFLSSPKVPVDDEKWFERVVRAAFSKRRKKLHNSLKSLGGIIEEGVIQETLGAVGIDSNRRAETLSLQEFSIMAEALRRTAS